MKNCKFETKAIRTQLPKTQQREHSVPLFLTSSFTFESAEQGAAIFKGEEDGNLYSRFSNPNTNEFIDKLCLLENCEKGVATASGMAAIYVTFATHLQQGDHIVASKNIFGNALYIIKEYLPKMGISYTLVKVDNADEWKQAIKPNTKLLYVETPANPTLKLADLSFLNQLCTNNNVLFVVDNCFASPYLQQPANFGADLVIHSATKFIDGQGRVLGGAIIGKEKPAIACYDFIRRIGASLSPFNAWVLSKSLETLAVRMDRHCDNALAVARYLESHPQINKVIYPFLSSFPQNELAKKQMIKGGGLVAFEINGDTTESQQFLNLLKLHSLTGNLGDSRSIATHPASTTHSKLSKPEQLAVDVTPGLIRLSVGLEHIDDLLLDVEQALGQVFK